LETGLSHFLQFKVEDERNLISKEIEKWESLNMLPHPPSGAKNQPHVEVPQAKDLQDEIDPEV
jgi:hypothetical protein